MIIKCTNRISSGEVEFRFIAEVCRTRSSNINFAVGIGFDYWQTLERETLCDCHRERIFVANSTNQYNQLKNSLD